MTTVRWFFLFIIFATAILLGFAAACGRYSSKKEGMNMNGFQYAEFSGEILVNGQRSLINRHFYISDSQIMKAAVTYVTTFNKIAGHTDTTSFIIQDFSTSDSLFSFDSFDSTMLAFSVADVQNIGFSVIQFSAFWLMGIPGFETGYKADDQDSLTIAGYRCRKIKKTGVELWVFGSQPMAISVLGIEGHQQEQMIRVVADTIFNRNQFLMPTGFRRLVPSLKE